MSSSTLLLRLLLCWLLCTHRPPARHGVRPSARSGQSPVADCGVSQRWRGGGAAAGGFSRCQHFIRHTAYITIGIVQGTRQDTNRLQHRQVINSYRHVKNTLRQLWCLLPPNAPLFAAGQQLGGSAGCPGGAATSAAPKGALGGAGRRAWPEEGPLLRWGT